jgi:tRNA (guanine-N7-)-methyltransferase
MPVSAHSESRAHSDIRTFSRRGGRPLSAQQRELIASVLPGCTLAAHGAIALDDVFAGCAEVWLEIGFGGGEHLIGQAARNTATGLIGCEPFYEGVSKALTRMQAAGLSNVRIWPDDARGVLARLPRASLARVFILFPDPWPKRRQQKRRLVQPAFADALHRVCKPGAEVRFATDVISYADAALSVFLAHGGYAFAPASARDWRRPPADHITTRYEQKKLGDCAPVWFDFTIRSAAGAEQDSPGKQAIALNNT